MVGLLRLFLLRKNKNAVYKRYNAFYKLHFCFLLCKKQSAKSHHLFEICDHFFFFGTISDGRSNADAFSIKY